MEPNESNYRAFKLLGLLGLGICFLASIIETDWGVRRPIAEFAETFAAFVLTYVPMVLGISAGVWSGMRISNASGRAWAGWVVGLTVCFGVHLLLYSLCTTIPGVGWRIIRITND